VSPSRLPSRSAPGRGRRPGRPFAQVEPVGLDAHLVGAQVVTGMADTLAAGQVEDEAVVRALDVRAQAGTVLQVGPAVRAPATDGEVAVLDPKQHHVDALDLERSGERLGRRGRDAGERLEHSNHSPDATRAIRPGMGLLSTSAVGPTSNGQMSTGRLQLV